MIYIHFDNFADLRRVLDVGFHVLSIYSVYLLERETGGGAKDRQLDRWGERRKEERK